MAFIQREYSLHLTFTPNGEREHAKDDNGYGTTELGAKADVPTAVTSALRVICSHVVVVVAVAVAVDNRRDTNSQTSLQWNEMNGNGVLLVAVGWMLASKVGFIRVLRIMTVLTMPRSIRIFSWNV